MYIGGITSSAYANLDNFATVSVFVGQPPPMIISGLATVPLTIVVKFTPMYLNVSTIALLTVHCSVRKINTVSVVYMLCFSGHQINNGLYTRVHKSASEQINIVV